MSDIKTPLSPDLAAKVIVGGICALVGCGIAMWTAVATVCAFSGLTVPPFTLTDAVTSLLYVDELPDYWDEPGLNVPVTLTVAVFYAAVLAVTAWTVLSRVLGRLRPGRAEIKVDRVPGTATASQVRKVASQRSVLARAGSLRPSLTAPTIGDVGYRLGKAHGIDVWSTVEDAMVLVGPPRSGKGLHIVVSAILDAPGAVVTTSTRPDNLTLTMLERATVGPVAVFDPQDLVPGISAGVRWSPVRGCRDPQTAMIRSRGFASATGMGEGVENAGFWQAQSEAVIRCLLHAADLDGRDARDLYRWAVDPVAAGTDAVDILSNHPQAADGWSTTLTAAAQADQRTRDSIWMGVRAAFDCLSDPRVMATVVPRHGDGFDPRAFIEQRGTLYLLGTASGAAVVGPLIAALVEDIVETARQLAARQPGARLDPPLALVLDEIANFTGLPSLPSLMSEGGGSGITTIAVFQSLAQIRDKWGEQTAGAIWDSAIVKILLGGSSNARDLSDMVTLIGERDETTMTISRDPRMHMSSSTSLRKVPIMDAAALRTLPLGVGVIMLRSTPPIIAALFPWPGRHDANRLVTGRRQVEASMLDGSP